MKIAQIVCVYPPYKGGIGESALNIARVLKSAGNEVETFTIGGDDSGQREGGTAYLKAFPGLGNGGVLPRLCWRLKDFDLIYLHYPFFGTSEIIWFLKKFVWGKKKKLVIQYHMDVVLPNLFLKILSIPSALIFNSLFKNADLIISASLDYVQNGKLKNIYQKYSSSARATEDKPQKFVEIPFGVDLNRFKRFLDSADAPLGMTDKFKILFVGGLDKAHYFKGINILLQALNLLDKENKNWQLEIVGDGDLRAEYEKQANEFGIAGKVKFSGRATDEDLPKKYQAADCFVLPSINKGEAFGIVLIEAMASGLPVIASDLPGVRGVFTAESGLKIKPGDAEDLAAKLKYLMINPAQRIEMGKAARREAEEKYSEKEVGKKLVEEIEALV
jgi:glycosyltransferase involved in cell wall biosynthesis